MNKITRDYYEKNADQFIQATSAIDMNDIYQVFLPLLSASDCILDAGCGSGRDSIYFQNKGFKVIAIDSCEKFIDSLKSYAGIQALHLGFDEINLVEEVEAIWACASLLHIEREKLSEVIGKLSNALKVNGIFYASFKYGSFSGERNSRLFTDLDEKEFELIIKNFPELKLIKYWITDDLRKDRTSEKWFNVLLKKLQ